mmetsp:Transcript_18913/g.39360  ORF Transcript_18913/g.39360 Transcript_18913/m.39360 type:complete len:226 (+) Transcript_18913:2837-3514(+)
MSANLARLQLISSFGESFRTRRALAHSFKPINIGVSLPSSSRSTKSLSWWTSHLHISGSALAMASWRTVTPTGSLTLISFKFLIAAHFMYLSLCDAERRLFGLVLLSPMKPIHCSSSIMLSHCCNVSSPVWTFSMARFFLSSCLNKNFTTPLSTLSLRLYISFFTNNGTCIMNAKRIRRPKLPNIKRDAAAASPSDPLSISKPMRQFQMQQSLLKKSSFLSRLKR